MCSCTRIDLGIYVTQVDFRKKKKKLAPMFCAALTLTKTYYTGTGGNSKKVEQIALSRQWYIASQEKKLF